MSSNTTCTKIVLLIYSKPSKNQRPVHIMEQKIIFLIDMKVCDHPVRSFGRFNDT